jgi:hypothetical protein
MRITIPRVLFLALMFSQFLLQAETIMVASQPEPPRLVFVPSQLSIEAGSSVMLNLQIQDAKGKLAPADSRISVSLQSASPSGRFRVENATVPLVWLELGESSKWLRYEDTAAGVWNLTATYSNFSPAIGYVAVNPAPFDGFQIEIPGTVQSINAPFEITIRAVDHFDNTVPTFDMPVSLTDQTGTVWPSETDRFTAGQWHGSVLVRKAGFTRITASGEGKNANSTLLTISATSASKIECGFKAASQDAVGRAVEMSAAVTDRFADPIIDTTVSWEIASTPIASEGERVMNATTRTNSEGTTTNVLIFGDRPGEYVIVARELSSSQFCTLTATAEPGGDFVIGLAPYDPHIGEGKTLSLVVKVTKRGALNDYVSLNVSQSPSDIFAVLSKVKELPDFESQLTITPGPYVKPGIYEMVLTGESEGLSSSVKFNLQVVPDPFAPAPVYVVGVSVALLVGLCVCWIRFCWRRYAVKS